MEHELERREGIAAPKSYWKLSENEKNELLNQCGGDPITTALVPDSILGTDVSIACNIHDWMYVTGKNGSDKEKADLLFKKNLQTIVEQENQGGPIKAIKKGIAYVYSAVASFLGHLYF